MTFHVPEQYRIRTGAMGSDESYGNNGQFLIKSLKLVKPLRVQASDGEGWEHVSVSLAERCPTWFEMCFVKDLFWGPDDLVVQFHPPKADYVDVHPYCLHLWRKVGTNAFCERPPKEMIG
jgi:hypothetical protein